MAGDDRYRLAPVRDARERAERGELADAVGDAKTTEAALAEARARVAAARDAVARAVASREGAHPPARLVLADRFAARRRGELVRAVAEELRAEAAHDA